MDKVWQIHVDHVVRLDVLIPQVHHHPQQSCVHLLLDDHLITHLLHGHPTLALPIKIIHPGWLDTDCALARLLPCMGGKLGSSIFEGIRCREQIRRGLHDRGKKMNQSIHIITKSNSRHLERSVFF